MQFPIYNIDISSLGDNYWLLNEIIRYDVFYISDDEEIWRNFFFNMRFIDCQGDIYILATKSKIKDIFYFLFRKVRYKCNFVATGEKLSIEETRKIMENQIKNSNGKFGQEFIDRLKQATTFEDLISWRTVDMENI